MALLYTELAKLAKDGPFGVRIQFALWRAANRVRVESAATPNHAERLVWAKRELQGPSPQFTATMNLVLTTGSVFNTGAAVTDDQLQSVIDGLVDQLALNA